LQSAVLITMKLLVMNALLSLVTTMMTRTLTKAEGAGATDTITGRSSNTITITSSNDDDDSILLEDFSQPVLLHHWSTMNDPVMGGQSKSTVTIDRKNGVAHFQGYCAIVPFLKAPGFVTMVTGNGDFPFHRNEKFPDVSSCRALSLRLKSNVHYNGYRISFGNEHVKNGRHARGYKAPLVLEQQQEHFSSSIDNDEFGDVVIPFHDFSSKWDEKTGDIQISCAEDPQYCPSTKWLKNMKTFSIWGEGVEGTIDLEIKEIRAIGCIASTSSSIGSTITNNNNALSNNTAPVEASLFSTPLTFVYRTTATNNNDNSVGILFLACFCVSIVLILVTYRRRDGHWQRCNSGSYQVVRNQEK